MHVRRSQPGQCVACMCDCCTGCAVQLKHTEHAYTCTPCFMCGLHVHVHEHVQGIYIVHHVTQYILHFSCACMFCISICVCIENWDCMCVCTSVVHVHVHVHGHVHVCPQCTCTLGVLPVFVQGVSVYWRYWRVENRPIERPSG